jgi:hypothetical protein
LELELSNGEKEVQMRKLMVLLVVLTLNLAPSAVALADKTFTNGDIKGSYAFSFQGEILGVGPAAASGMFKANGRGSITEAVRTISFGGSVTQTFTCTLSVNPNGTGSAECPLDDPIPGFPAVETFDFVLEDNAKGVRFVSTTPGFVVLGSGRKQ